MWDYRLHPNFQSYPASVPLLQSFKDEALENLMLTVYEQIIIIIIIIIIIADAAALCEIIRR